MIDLDLVTDLCNRLSKVCGVAWDRAVHNDGSFVFYGWIRRGAGAHRDFLVLMFGPDAGNKAWCAWTTSSAEYSEAVMDTIMDSDFVVYGEGTHDDAACDPITKWLPDVAHLVEWQL